MKKTNLIYEKLESFIKKFYKNELIKGFIFFIGLGLLYFIFTLLIEYYLWLPSIGRIILFWIFVIFEILLLFRFILTPIFKLLNLRKGINYKDASAIIENYFFEVGDKLTNFLQLSNTNDESELVFKAIEQKADSLQFVPFNSAINFKRNIKFLPWIIVPILLLSLCIISGNSHIITKSFGRVVHYNKKYIPPAPFQFYILNKKLKTKKFQDFILQVKTEGKIVPEDVMIFIGNENYYLEKNKSGIFEFHFERPFETINFYLKANSVSSLNYQLSVIEVPTISDFEMELIFPKYLNRKYEIVKGNGSTIIPEGTLVKWKVTSVATKELIWSDYTKNVSFFRDNNLFYYSKNIFQNIDYQILSSNDKVKYYEKLNYNISVIKDKFPVITVYNPPDSLKLDKDIVLGEVSDDYGLSKLQMVYYERDKPEKNIKIDIPVKKSNFDRFYYSFPGDLKVKKGILYNYYFEVFDNDFLHHFKSTKSAIFSHREVTDEEHEVQLLLNQNSDVNSLSESIKEKNKQLDDFNDLQKIIKEKNNLEFKDKKRIDELIKRQKMQDEIMQSFSKKLEENLEQFKTEDQDELREKLQERFKNTDKEIEKNNELLKELEDLTNKIKEEELFDKIEKLKQNSKNQAKNLEQLVELTKRYYIQKKIEQLINKLEKLAEKQEYLSDTDKKNTFKNQEEINQEFLKFKEDFKNFNKENLRLKNPIKITSDKYQEDNIDIMIEKALDYLKDNNKKEAVPVQKKAAEIMKSFEKKIKGEMESFEGKELEEDIRVLRQILDNLLAFSFAQEDLMLQFNELYRNSPSYSKYLKIQQNLKQQFKHIDDSLFAMSLRNPAIDELITKEVENIHYNLDKSIEKLANTMILKGVSHQQYSISSANKLADFLSNILGSIQDKIQMKMNTIPGKKEMKLPDIIKKQQELEKKMKQQIQKGNSKSDGKEGEYGEGESHTLFEIYKEQQRLKEALQKILSKKEIDNDGKKILDKIKEIEKDLLNKGFKNETFKKMINLNNELLKLDNAIEEQGKNTKRESKMNTVDYKNTNKTLPKELQKYFNSIEILNRQSLPLHPDYNKKVQAYFK